MAARKKAARKKAAAGRAANRRGAQPDAAFRNPGAGNAPWIEGVVPEPSAVPALSHLRGYLGDSDRPGYFRLYLNAELGAWIDVPLVAFKQGWQQPEEGDPMRSATILVDSHARVYYFAAGARTAHLTIADLLNPPSRGTGWGEPPQMATRDPIDCSSKYKPYCEPTINPQRTICPPCDTSVIQTRDPYDCDTRRCPSRVPQNTICPPCDTAN